MAFERIRTRRDTTAAWAMTNPVLGLGELGIDVTLQKVKAGDGLRPWNELPFLSETEIVNTLDSARTDAALSAAQGKALNQALGAVTQNLNGLQGAVGGKLNKGDVLNTLDSARPDAALSAAQGKVLGDKFDIISALVNASTNEKLRVIDLKYNAVGDNNTITIEYPFHNYCRTLFLYFLTTGDSYHIPPMFGVLQTSVGELNPDLPIDKQWAYINNNAILTGWDQVNFSLKLKDAEAGVTVDNVTQNLKLQKSFGTHGSSIWYAHGFILVYNTMDGKAMTLTFSKE